MKQMKEKKIENRFYVAGAQMPGMQILNPNTVAVTVVIGMSTLTTIVGQGFYLTDHFYAL